jgi:hypothetical protein
MKKSIVLAAIAAVAAATLVAWSRADRPSPQPTTVGARAQAPREAAMSPFELMQRTGPLPTQQWDAH